jgi:signal peptide peptidase SppA
MIESCNLWLMDQDRLIRFHQVCRPPPTASQLQDLRRAQFDGMRRAGKVAVLPIQGVIEQKGWWGCSTEIVEQQLDKLVDAGEVDAIVLDIDSPGGSCYGVEELAERIYAARARKPIYAVANSLAASAAYWIATAATQLLVTPSGDVGSVGVFAIHAELSKALEREGVKVTIAKAGRYKAEMNPFEPLTQDARDHLQETVDAVYTKFVRAVARNRGVAPALVREKFGQGRCVSADQAMAAGMADQVQTLNALLQRLGGGAVSNRDRGASLEILRLRHQRRRLTSAPAAR